MRKRQPTPKVQCSVVVLSHFKIPLRLAFNLIIYHDHLLHGPTLSQTITNIHHSRTTVKSKPSHQNGAHAFTNSSRNFSSIESERFRLGEEINL